MSDLKSNMENVTGDVRGVIQACNDAVRKLRKLFETICEQLGVVAKFEYRPWDEIHDVVAKFEYRPWDEIHDYDNNPPESLGVPWARVPSSRRVTKWRTSKYSRS